MTDHDYGPLRTYEITWQTGHIERVQGHQVLFDSAVEGFPTLEGHVIHYEHPRFQVHGEFDGHWRLVIAAPEADLLSIRDVTEREEVQPS